MARASAIALLTLMLFLPELLVAQTTSSIRLGPRLRPDSVVLNPRWTVGYGLWTEESQMARADGRMYKITSSVRTLSLGYQMDWMQKKTGWFIESQAHWGDSSSLSRDPSLTYFHSGASVLGVSATAVKHWNFERPRLFLGMGLSTLWRQMKYEVPQGYSMNRQEQRFVSHAVFDFSFSVAPRFEATQRFGIPLDGNGHFWQIGLRRL